MEKEGRGWKEEEGCIGARRDERERGVYEWEGIMEKEGRG